MKAIIIVKENKNTISKVIENLISYDIDDFIVFTDEKFTRSEKDYYRANKINVVFLYDNGKENTITLLKNIKGTINSRFLIAYSPKIDEIDVEKMILAHKDNQTIATLSIIENKLAMAIFEQELFDYIKNQNNLESEVIPRIAEDAEVSIFLN